jgi:hypothetical protein
MTTRMDGDTKHVAFQARKRGISRARRAVGDCG